jgi:hypothetical protein
VEVILRPFFTPKWDARTSGLDEIPAKLKRFFPAAVNLTIPG